VESELGGSVLIFVRLICLGLGLCLLPAGCKVESAGEVRDLLSQPTSTEASEGGDYSYERSLRIAEEAKARIELDDKPWPDRHHSMLGRVDLKGDGQKSRGKVRVYG
jgi:hypothetical protein